MNEFKDKTILITGGTGSFGRTLCDYLLTTETGEIRIFSRDELKQELMRVELCNPKVKFYIGDVRDRSSVDAVMRGVHYVFHAAALKQVPSCEFFPMQAVMTNVMGSHNVIESAVAHGVERLVCLSTDKAVYPINTMGITKALMEKLVQSACRLSVPHDTVVCSVRYGNVMSSRGSVIPLFIKQIREGTALTVTEPSMTRFLLPLWDAVSLVLYAFQHSRPGDLFIKKAPACTVGDLAQALKSLFGVDVPVKTIGMRHGEKVYETLASREELVRAEDLGDYFRVPMDDRDLNYAKYFTEGDVGKVQFEDYHSDNAYRLSGPEIESLLLSLPEVRAELLAYKGKNG
jgi:UDP-glucose 4-epimerase